MHEHHTESYVALLRGINVGGKNMLPMTDLRDMFVASGCRGVRTYIQSGNVVFTTEPEGIAALPNVIATRIAERAGLRVPVILRSATQLGEVLQHNPFLAEGAEVETLHVYFLADLPDAANVAALDPDRSPPDAFAVHGQEVYLRLPNGMARTKLTNAYFDSKLATISTARNWRTITTIFEMMACG